MGGEMREDSVDDREFELLLMRSLVQHHNLYHHALPQPSNHHNAYGGHGHGSSVAQKMNGLYGICDDTLSYTCASAVSGFSLQSDGSSSSLFSGGCAFSDTESPTPQPPEDLKSQKPYHHSSICPNGFRLDSKIPDSPVRKRANESLVDELSLCWNLSAMCISNVQEDAPNFKGVDTENYGSYHKFGKGAPDYTAFQSIEQLDGSNFRGSPVDQYGFQFRDSSINESHGANVERHGVYHNFGRAGSYYAGLSSPSPKTPMMFHGQMSTQLYGLQQGYRMGSLSGSNCCNIPISSAWKQSKEQTFNYYQTRTVPSNLMNLPSRLSIPSSLLCAQQNGANLNEDRAVLGESNQHGMPISSGKIRSPSKIVVPQEDGLEAFTDDDSFIIQGRDLSALANNATTQCKHLERRSQLGNRPQAAATCESIYNAKTYLPPQYSSLAEARGYIYLIAKDQNGCRFLQRMFDEGSPRDVQIIFDEIIDHVVELMVNPFGNYLVQKLLDVCTEEQRMQVLLMITKQPGELIRISLNMHGTRAVQKLIETLKTRQQISLVISSLEPGFHSLMIDVNGNHVVQRCLQCLSNADNKLIFVAAAKYCVDIGTHQHGCCVLQRCISHSTGQYRENLVAEISANGLLLAQDSFGNYVVQFILELKIPSATSNLISQFEGNYVHLSTQRFSSHVVEKCLMLFNEKNQSRIIHELLSTSHFEQLLQDPHANYVIQTALRLSEGHLHSSLVAAIEAHRAVVRNSPYAKKIFSQKIMKK